MKAIYFHGAAWVIGLFCVVSAQAQKPEASQDRLNKQERTASAMPETAPTSEQGGTALPPGAVVPQLIRYSGVVKDQLGKARNGMVGITFAIYKEQEGGAALWLETQNVELDDQGRYTVLLGATKSEGLPLHLFMAAESRWLGAQVQLPGEVELPRVLLVSVPYALKAADAETLGGKPASVFVTTEQSGGGTAGQRSASAGMISPAVSGTGATNVVAKWLDNAGTLGT